jgi:hypothetical protein
MGIALNRRYSLVLHLYLDGTPYGTHAADAIDLLASQSNLHREIGSGTSHTP